MKRILVMFAVVVSSFAFAAATATAAPPIKRSFQFTGITGFAEPAECIFELTVATTDKAGNTFPTTSCVQTFDFDPATGVTTLTAALTLFFPDGTVVVDATITEVSPDDPAVVKQTIEGTAEGMSGVYEGHVGTFRSHGKIVFDAFGGASLDLKGKIRLA